MDNKFSNTYHNDFSNTSSLPTYDNNAGPNQEIPAFTATGRPYIPSNSKHGSGLHNTAVADGMGAGPADLLPRRYNDDSIINIPVLPPGVKPQINFTAEEEGPIKRDSGSGLKFWKSSGKKEKRKSSGSKQPFVMKDVTRGEYLKYYAKDDDGKYIGTEAPAEDCILRHASDHVKWRAAGGTRNDFGPSQGDVQAP